jgi:sulfite exporter TauE/SafE
VADVVALVTTVFVASLLGSVHCAGMCGVFVAVAVEPGTDPAVSRRRLQIAYNGGRLVSYATLGAIAGGVGRVVDLGGAAVGLQRGALLFAGAALVVFALSTLLGLAGVRLPFRAPPTVRTPFVRWFGKLRSRRGQGRSFAIGALSVLLPCGWLYAFVVTAAGTGSIAGGALTMAVFWSGTLPLLLAIGAGIQRLAGPLRRKAPALAALALLIVGLAALAGRFDVIRGAEGDDATCHTAELPDSGAAGRQP